MGRANLREKLQDPTIYPESTVTVEMRETHISLVFLTDHYAYKIKKPVDLGFLDFSTLDRRRFYCDQELELNRRLTSDVYLEVCPLRQDKSRYTFDGAGAIVDYALKMRRLPATQSLEALLQDDAITPAIMATLAQRLVDFHTAHPLPIGIEPHDHLTQVGADWQENFTQTTDCIGTTLSNDTYGHIRRAVTAFLDQHSDWFTQRVHAERIRDCHGDLRAEHIYFEPEQIQIIDCIEFNQRFRYIDVASEIAFLAVDLERLGASHLAYHFHQAYVQYSGDVSLYRLLDFYRCYRAYVRGKVISMRLHNAPPPEKAPLLQQQAETFFAVAARYATRLTRPLLLLTTGLIASGKSTVAEGLATELNACVLSSDRLRKERAGLSPHTSQPAAYGEGMYSAEAKQRTYEALANRAREQLMQGHAVLLDASFAKQAERQRMATLAHECGADYGILECLAPEEVLRTRLQEREHRADTLSDAREDIFTAFKRDYESVQHGETTCYIRLDTTQNVAWCVQQALALLQEQRP